MSEDTCNESKKQIISYAAEPTIAQFHMCDADVRGIMGPVGSGKSVGCCVEIVSRAARQAPDSLGVRRTRWCVVRNTYSQLLTTTIKTWQEWFPYNVCTMKLSHPITGRMKFPLSDGTSVDLELFFLALDRPDDVKKLLSLEVTGVWINEARELSKIIVEKAFERTGRFPPKRVAPMTWTGLIMDTNPPADDHWWYRMCEDVKPEGWAFFKQPGALVLIRDGNGKILRFEVNPKAENVQNQPLGYAYWTRMIPGADPERILVDCCGQYGSTFDGRPVYQGMFSDALHVSVEPLTLYRGRPLHLGFDFGLTPACAFGQVAPDGQLRILRELSCERGGIKQFVKDAVRPMLTNVFPGIPVVSTGDPAGVAGSQHDDELSCLRQLALLGIPTKPAPTNVFLARRQAVIDRLTRTIDGKPAFILDPSCKMLRRGFLGGYKFERVQVTGEERYKDVPCKNNFSHIADALQYLVLGVDSVETAGIRPPPPVTLGGWGGMV